MGITAGDLAGDRDWLSTENTEFAKATGNTDTAESNLAKAKADQKKAQTTYNEKNKKYNDTKAEQDKLKSEAKKHKVEADSLRAQAAIEQDKLDAKNEEIADRKDKITQLRSTGKKEDADEADALEEQNVKDLEDAAALQTSISNKNTSAGKEDEAANELNTSANNLDAGIKAAKTEKDAAEEKLVDTNTDVSNKQSDYDDAKKDEDNVLHEQAEKYPNTFGKEAQEYENDKKKKEEEDRARRARKIKEEKEAEAKAAAEKREDELDDAKLDAWGAFDNLSDAEEDRLDGANSIDELNKIVKNIKFKHRIKELKDALKNPNLTQIEQNKLATELYNLEHPAKRMEKINPNVAINEMTSNLLKGQGEGSFLKWDSPNYQLNGKMEDIIAGHLQPKMKFAYMGEFPGKLAKLDWMIKSMDKPKIDIESVEQIRNNVKRNYPVKYNYGDLNVTFWDDMDHKTVKALYEYFANDIYQHSAVPLRGTFKLRDSILIPSFDIYELVTEKDGNLKYTFENAILSSMDFDNSEDESDDGVHTIQAVFKIERFTVSDAIGPSFLNPTNMPSWQ